MAETIKKTEDLFKSYLERIIHYSPTWLPGMMLFGFIIVFGWPASVKLISLSNRIVENQGYITLADRSNADVLTMKQDLEGFKQKVAEFENKLPKRLKTTLIIETLQEITRKSKLQFSSLEPLPIKKYELKETGDVFVELPVKVKLNCSYYDLIEFIKQIETAAQLMKITDLTIKDDPNFEWKHVIEFSISAFSKGESDD